MAWTAHWAGMSVVLIDRGEPNSCSRVAAGLVTPITGSRAAASWRWDDFYSAAHAFYQRVELATKASVWLVSPALRVYRDEKERQLYQSKWMDIESAEGVRSIGVQTTDVVPLGVQVPHGCCLFSPAARLLTVDYLNATRRYFEHRESFLEVDLQCDEDIEIADVAISGIEAASSEADYTVRIRRFKVEGKRVVFCQGVAARENAYFASLPLHPARGDILTIESNRVHCDHVLHRDAWVVPIGQRRFLVGATYERSSFHSGGQQELSKAHQFRSELVRRWESMVEGQVASGDHTVVDQRWAIRPASYDRHPLIGPHESIPGVYCLNGLGSKGSLMSPRLAEMLVGAMHGSHIDSALHLSRRK